MVTKLEVPGDKTTTGHLELRLDADAEQTANSEQIEITPN
jgi:hypothetical protein